MNDKVTDCVTFLKYFSTASKYHHTWVSCVQDALSVHCQGSCSRFGCQNNRQQTSTAVIIKFIALFKQCNLVPSISFLALTALQVNYFFRVVTVLLQIHFGSRIPFNRRHFFNASGFSQ